MNLNNIADNIVYRIAGTLYWTEDADGSIWVLLARRTYDSLLGRVYSYAIPTVELKNNENAESAASRAVHDELGIMPETTSFSKFFSEKSGNIEVTLYSKHVHRKINAKCKGAYKDAMWFCLPDDCKIDDGDLLLRDELLAFASSLNGKSIAV